MKRYDAYKSTGIPWIPEVPEHWKMRKLRHFIEMISEKNHPQEPLLSVVRDQGVILRDVTSKEENHNAIPDDLSGYKLIEKGHFAINKMKAWQGSYGVSSYRGIVSPAYYTCRLNFEHKAFFNLAIRSDAYVPFFTQYSKGIRVGQWDLSPIGLKEIPFFLPLLSEQRAIVAYIERKVRQIDAYIARQAEQIEYLKELRQTIISHAVTRGIHPYTRFRLTGIPWIPEVPEHWEVVPFGRHFTYGKGLPITKADLLLEGVAVISYGQIHSKDNTGTSISEGMVRRVSPSYITTNPQSLLEKDDFVFADTSEDLEGVGNCAFNDYRETLFAGYHTIIARPINLAYPIYYAYLFRSNYWKNSVQAIVNGIKVYSINRGILKRSFLLLPPLSEQRAIVAYIEKKTATVDRMINACREQTELMKAYKQRLISDAVTGRINVLPHD